MARLALSDVNTLLNLNPRVLNYLQQEAATGTPILSIQDVTVQPTASTATLKLTLSAAPRDTIIGSWLTRNGLGTNRGANYVAASGAIIWQPGEPLTKDIVIQLTGNNVVGNNIQVILSSTIAGAKLDKSLGYIYFSTDTQVPPSGMTLVFNHDFINGFETSPTGLDSAGNPCWKSQLSSGRTQPGNKELGYYADQQSVPTCNPYPLINGQRSIQAECFPNGVLDTTGNTIPCPWNVVNGVTQTFKYTSPVLTTQKWPAAQMHPNMRAECDISMPLAGQIGAWPAFWMLPTSGAWPPEIDMMEWPNNATANPWIFYTTQHWPSGTGGDSMRSYPVDTRLFGATQDLTNKHTYGITLTDESVVFDFDGTPYVTMDNRSPGQSWYILLNLAVGGSWPGSPATNTQFPLHISLGGLRLYTLTV